MLGTRHLAFHNYLRIASSNQFAPVDILLGTYGDFSVTQLRQTVRFVACTCGNRLYFTDIYVKFIIPETHI